jgi:hypothetical protein
MGSNLFIEYRIACDDDVYAKREIRVSLCIMTGIQQTI